MVEIRFNTFNGRTVRVFKAETVEISNVIYAFGLIGGLSDSRPYTADRIATWDDEKLRWDIHGGKIADHVAIETIK